MRVVLIRRVFFGTVGLGLRFDREPRTPQLTNIPEIIIFKVCSLIKASWVLWADRV